MTTRRFVGQLACLCFLSLGFRGAAPLGAAEAKIEADKASSPTVAAADWPWWRGPNSDGVAAEQDAPLKWGASENILWKTPVPGRGHSSPTVVGNRVFLETADEQQQVQSVMCFDRASGRVVWKVDLHKGGFDPKAHVRNTQASSTIACDGQRVFATFLNGGAIWCTALDLDGRQAWQTKVGDFTSHWGYSSSPAIYKSFVIIAADHKGGGYLVALDRAKGAEQWRTDRPVMPNYPSPVVLHVAGKDQLLLAGCEQVASYDPMSGKPLWSCKGTTTECVGTVVADGDLVFASGGYPDRETICVRADGSGKVMWRNTQKVYVPSLLASKGYVYTVTDDGMAICWQAETGQDAWKTRLGGTFNSSPVLVGDRIYAACETGKTFVFRASPETFDLLAENQLGEDVFASPVVCGNQIFLRVAAPEGGKRQEMLYCIGGGRE